MLNYASVLFAAIYYHNNKSKVKHPAQPATPVEGQLEESTNGSLERQSSLAFVPFSLNSSASVDIKDDQEYTTRRKLAQRRELIMRSNVIKVPTAKEISSTK